MNQCIPTDEKLSLFPKSYNRWKSSLLVCRYKVIYGPLSAIFYEHASFSLHKTRMNLRWCYGIVNLRALKKKCEDFFIRFLISRGNHVKLKPHATPAGRPALIHPSNRFHGRVLWFEFFNHKLLSSIIESWIKIFNNWKFSFEFFFRICYFSPFFTF